MNGPFSDLAALEAHFRARGFVDQNGIADQSTAEFYSHVLVPEDDRPFLLTVQIMTGEVVGHLEAGLTAYFDPLERSRVNADLTALAASVVAAAKPADMPARLLRSALDDGRDDTFDVDGLRFQVVFPEREPDQTFEVAHVEISRPLDPGEWRGAVDEDDPGAAAVAACREILQARGHRLAERPISLTMSSDMGDERLDVMRTDDGSSLWLTTGPSGEAKLSVIAPDGAHEEL